MPWATTRRSLLRSTGATIAAASVFGLPGRSLTYGALAQDQPVELRAAGFVESQDQLKQTVAVLELYTEKHPGVIISPEFTDYGAYRDKLAIEAAGDNLPDMLSTNANLMSEYARKGILLPLDQFVPDPIDLADYAPSTVSGNTVDGVLYAIPNDCIAPALIYDVTAFEDAGVAMPEQMWTWEDYAQTATAIAQAVGGDFYGTEDGGMSDDACDMFFRGRGKLFYTPDGQLGFTAEDLTDWFAFWQQLRESGGAPPGEIQALFNGDDLSRKGLVAGRTAMFPQTTDTYIGFQNLLEHTVGLHMLPNGFGGSELEQHHYTYAGNSTSIAATSDHPETVLDVIQFMHFDPEGSAVFYGESGLIPASAAGREALAQNGSAEEKVLLEYINLILPSTAEPKMPSIPGASDVLGRMNEAVAFGQLSPAEAAEQFFAEIASNT